MLAEISIDDREHAVHIRDEAKVILVPKHNNGIVTSPACRRVVDRVDNVPQREIAKVDQRWIQPLLGSIVVGIEIALRAGIAATVLVVALVRRDE